MDNNYQLKLASKGIEKKIVYLGGGEDA